ncbi:uncharacterized protein LOC111693496 [Trichogramma pretiosum]|uniref:uncharacterized protein LOC111693496 n=1 Tax=Trichogramma pretiosum TaxID=7493 RepID=UPI000C719B84|nr:uncharacterized protein LOC111693496 [Trichogramma pretiosum]
MTAEEYNFRMHRFQTCGWFPAKYLRCKGNVEILKNLRGKLNWEMEEERHKFLNQLYPILAGNWVGPPPNLRDIFGKGEIDWLLAESVKNKHEDTPFLVDFLICTGYKDEPEVDKDGKTIMRRTTAIHHAAKVNHGHYYIDNLFKIYNRFDVNYTDETGFTHFHAACKFGRHDVVKKFLELGQDPDCLPHEESNGPPLHYALIHSRKTVARLLLRSGADPNSLNAMKSTPLHVICQRYQYQDDDLAEIFFKINDRKRQRVQVHALDEFGRTPLQRAVANLMPKTVDILLDNGADLSGFVFPTESHFDERLKRYKRAWIGSKLEVALHALKVVECLEKRGYESDRIDALKIMKIFAELEMFPKSAVLKECRHDEDEYPSGVERNTIRDNDPSLLLYDQLIQLRPKEAAKLVTNSDYSKLSRSIDAKCSHTGIPHTACTVHLCETMSREFFRRWALDPLLELTHGRLPIPCCEMIIDNLMNEDLLRICLAAEIIENEQSQMT